MLRQYSRKIGPFLAALFQPEVQLLPDYSRQVPAARAVLLKLLGVVAAIAVGAAYGRFFASLPPKYMLVLLAPLVLMAVLVIWVLPDRDTAPTGALTKLMLAFFAVSVAWPDYLALQLPGLPWISFRRLFLAPMCMTLLICVSTSAQFRKEMRETLGAEPILWKMLLGFIVMQLASIALAKDVPGGIKNFVNYQLIWTSVFFGSVYVFRAQNITEKFFRIFCAACMMIGFIGILEHYNEAVLWRDHIPSFLQVDMETMVGALLSPLRNGLFRSKSVYNQPLPFAEIMALVTPVILYFIFTAKRVWQRVAFVAVDVTLLYVLTLPQSRLGIVGYLISHALFVLVWSGRIWLRNRFSIVGPTITLAYPVLLIGVAGAIMSIGSLRDRVIGGHETIYSDQSRKVQKRMAQHVLLQNPILGHGPKQGPAALGFVGGEGTLTLDNYYLWIALDYGMIGFAFFYGMILLAIHRTFMISIRDVKADNNRALVVMTILTVFIFIKTVLSEEDNHSLLFILLGATMGLMWREKMKSAETPT